MKLLLFISIFLAAISAYGQTTKKVLFIGNSYTSANNLPLLVNNMATSTGDILIFDSHTPGGFRFMDHANNATTLAKINSNDWNYVALQAQSQETSLSQSQMETEVFPYAESLSNAIRANNECSQPMFYMTWGRKNGDAANCNTRPWVCTYEQMDDVIQATYMFMAESNVAELAPAGAVWRYLRENQPQIELYSADGSHPSLAGSYAVACAFYSMIYKKDPTFISWNSTLTENEANLIKMASKLVVFDNINNWDFTQDPVADFMEVIMGGEVTFTTTASNFDTVFWDFGDSTTSTEINPIHTYAESGSYNVSQTITKCGKTDVKTKTLNLVVLSTETNNLNVLKIFPNPTSSTINLLFNKKNEQVFITISDLFGKTIQKISKNNVADLQLNLSNISQGIYILNIITEDGFYIEKIFKK